MLRNLLNNIQSPQDIKKFDKKNLKYLCEEIRKNIIEIVSKNGGHLASNLGVVELTVAIHYIFNSPEDKIIFDVGHQCYAHKILTGRHKLFGTIRKFKGLSGFPNCKESKHDPFGTGHSSTSISAALGIAQAKVLLNKKGYTIAIIGDGALSGGLAYEALNNAGQLKKNFIVILNDNEMSISKSVGSMAYYLSKLRVKPYYLKTKNTIKWILNYLPIVGDKTKNFVLKIKSTIKKIIYKKTFFEDMGFSYYGPIDGHDLNCLIQTLSSVKQINKPILIHVNTKKGKGYRLAEDNPGEFHGVSKFNIKTGNNNSSNTDFSNAFGNALCNFAEKDKKICAITAAMKNATGLLNFSCSFKERFFDVGIAESHAVTFASGLAAGGLLPVFAVYSTFLQRSYDQIIHDAAIQNLRIVIAVDRSGIVGEDGKTHQGIFDVNFLNHIPNVTIFSPSFYSEINKMLEFSLYKCKGIAVIRYPKGRELHKPKDFLSSDGAKDFEIYGRTDLKIAIIVYGRLFSYVCLAKNKLEKKGIKVCVIKLNKIKPISTLIFDVLKNNFTTLFFFEESILCGGIGEHFTSLLIKKGIILKIYIKAIDNKFIEQSKMDQSLQIIGLDENGIFEFIIKKIS